MKSVDIDPTPYGVSVPFGTKDADWKPVAADMAELGWHAAWLIEYSRERATVALLEMCSASDKEGRGCDGWERVGLDLVGHIKMAMSGIEEADFIERATLGAIEIYLRRFHQLLSTLGPAGSA